MRYPACLRMALWPFASAGLTPVVQAASPLSAERYAQEQTRAIATYFPGRMAGSPVELLAAEHLQLQFRALGCQSDLRAFNTRYRYGAPAKAGKGKFWSSPISTPTCRATIAT